MIRRPALPLVGLALLAGLPGAWTVPAAAAPASQQCTAVSQEVYRAVPWTQQRLAPARVWPLTDGTGITVAVIDTGVDAKVPQLAGRVLRGVDVVNGTGTGTADDDCFGHGTFVAGIIAAAPVAGTGVAGIAPGVTILPIRQANNTSDGTASGLARGIRAAVDAGASVVNISASSFFPSEALRLAVQYAADHDVLLVAAASNQAQQGNPVPYPAGYPSVVAVGAVGQDGRRSDFSEVGDYLDLVAPGVEVVGLSRAAPGHLVGSGTSYATPFVAAVAALVRAYHPALSAAQVKRRLELTADRPGTAVPDPQVGWGMVNPYNAVTAVLPQEAASARGQAQQLPPPMPRLVQHTPDTRARDRAFAVALTGAAVAGFGVLLAYLLPRGARRRWRGADYCPPPPAGPGEPR